jgi:hypothetical protein
MFWCVVVRLHPFLPCGVIRVLEVWLLNGGILGVLLGEVVSVLAGWLGWITELEV